MSVAIVDYGSGNLHSAAKAFERAAREAGHDQPIVVTRDPDAVRRADRVVLPGVGAFADCRRGLDAVAGMVEALEETVRSKGRPFLGICVGMQLMAERGREYEVTEGLGWIAGEVDRIAPSDPELKIPHMGWNTLDVSRAAQAARRHCRSGPRGCTPISCTPISSSRRGPRRSRRAGRLWRAGHRDCRARQHGRHAIPSGKEPEARACADRQFPEVEAVILFPAIDLKDGLAVRLEQGDMARATVFNRDPAAQAHMLRDAGLQASARRRSRRRLRRQADERRGGRAHPGRRSDSACSSAAASATWRRSRAGSARASTASSSAPRRCAIRRW